MSSPFETPQEFLEVKGPLYTFANSPVWLTVFLILSVIVFLWFIYASYQIKGGSDSKNSDIATMSILILTGFISLAQSVYVSGSTVIEAYRQKSSVSASRKTRIPPKLARTNTARRYRTSRSPQSNRIDRA